MKVQVLRSARRRKTVQARQVGDVLRVSIPATMSAAEETRWVAEMVRRMERRTSAGRIDLERRAGALADQLGLGRPKSIRWVDNQETRWGSCTPRDGTIRISSRLSREPAWVIDYVIVHELAHLTVAGHGRRFWQLVDRYPLAERARGFLLARGLDASEPEPARSKGGRWDRVSRAGENLPAVAARRGGYRTVGPSKR
jgi:predicted metal-dependent hydrolase